MSSFFFFEHECFLLKTTRGWINSPVNKLLEIVEFFPSHIPKQISVSVIGFKIHPVHFQAAKAELGTKDHVVTETGQQ